MAEFTLKPKEVKTLRVYVGEESFEIPLQGSLSWEEAMSLETPQGTYAFMKNHVPKKIFSKLKIEEYNELVEVWKEESIKNSGKTPGES